MRTPAPDVTVLTAQWHAELSEDIAATSCRWYDGPDCAVAPHLPEFTTVGA